MGRPSSSTPRRTFATTSLKLDAASNVRDNVALYGGGVFLEAGTVRGGTVDGTAGDDGVEISAGVVQNTRPVGGGGIAATGTSRIEGTTLGGSAAGSGGALSVFAGDVVLVD